MEREIALPIHRLSVLECLKYFSFSFSSLPAFCGSISYGQTLDLHDWRSSSCRCERLGVFLFTFWQMLNKLLPLGFVTQHSPTAFGKLCRCIVSLDIFNSGNQGFGPRSVLPSLQPLLELVVSFLECWPCSSDEILKLFLLSHLVYQIPHWPASRHSEIINCGKSQGKNHQYFLNLPKNQSFYLWKHVPLSQSRIFLMEFDTHFTEYKAALEVRRWFYFLFQRLLGMKMSKVYLLHCYWKKAASKSGIWLFLISFCKLQHQWSDVSTVAMCHYTIFSVFSWNTFWGQ